MSVACHYYFLKVFLDQSVTCRFIIPFLQRTCTSKANYCLYNCREFVLVSVTKPIVNIQHSNFVINKSVDEMLRTLNSKCQNLMSLQFCISNYNSVNMSDKKIIHQQNKIDNLSKSSIFWLITEVANMCIFNENNCQLCIH